ncbi:hypothetical protein K438DRAFT_1749562 [Mycena galopus ATCC 62051]|nr:hypothetical protein K438DRAFT_1749562 [Mycena galopus ATCC 62051]
MRFGPDDPVLWPRIYSERFCYLAAIPKAPTSPQAQEELGVMWWNPTPANFVCPASGTTLTRGLGRLAGEWFMKLVVRSSALIDKYEQYVKSPPTGTKPLLLLPQLVQRLQLSLERLKIPSTYIQMVIGVTTVQHEYLELTGLLRYMTKYKPRLEGIEDPDANPALPDNCLGCFTNDPRIAQLFWKACLPCWLFRPLKVFTDEYIGRVVTPFSAIDFLEMKPAAGFSPVQATDRLDDCLSLVHHCTENTPWYRNPFEDTSPDVTSSSGAGSSRAGTAGEQSAKAGPSQNTSSRSAPSSGKGSPYAAARAQVKAQEEAKEPNPNAKQSRDKFLPIDRPEMPSTIAPWATALAAIDRSCPPFCGIDLPQCYVMPEPSLLASPEDGKVVTQGKDGTHAQACSAIQEDLLRPAFSACGIDALTEFPVPPETVPPLHMHRTKELLWELAEINFRYEFLALDAHASGLDRPDKCCRCFAGEGLIGMDFRESQRGLASHEAMEHLPYLLCMKIDTAKAHREWVASSVRQLEQKVAQYYTQSFYELFGRPAVVPICLEHEIAS